MGVQGVQVWCSASPRDIHCTVLSFDRPQKLPSMQVEELWSLDKESLEALR